MTRDEEEDGNDAPTSCFDFRLQTRLFGVGSTSSSTDTRHAPLSLLTRMLCSSSDSSVPYSTVKPTQIPSTSSTCRCGTMAPVSPPPFFVNVLPSPDLLRQCFTSAVTGNVDHCRQVPAELDVTGDVAGRDRRLMTSRRGHARHKQRSQKQQHQTMLMAGWTYYVQPAPAESSSSSSSGLHRKRTSFHHEVQVIEIDQTQRVHRIGAAQPRHTVQLRESEIID